MYFHQINLFCFRKQFFFQQDYFTFSQVQLVVDRDLIYAIGGMENGGYTSTVEVYDPVQQVWSEVDSMSQARCNPGKYTNYYTLLGSYYTYWSAGSVCADL